MCGCIIKVAKISYKSSDDNLLNKIIDIYLEAYQDLYNLPKKEDVIQIEKKIYGENYKFLSVKNLKDSLKNEYNILLICIYKKIIVGFAFLQIWYNNAVYLEEFHIKREFRGKGIGSAFLSKVEEYLKKMKINKIIVDAHEKSISFYTKNEYKDTGRRYWEYKRLVKVL